MKENTFNDINDNISQLSQQISDLSKYIIILYINSDLTSHQEDYNDNMQILSSIHTIIETSSLTKDINERIKSNEELYNRQINELYNELNNQQSLLKEYSNSNENIENKVNDNYNTVTSQLNILQSEIAKKADKTLLDLKLNKDIFENEINKLKVYYNTTAKKSDCEKITKTIKEIIQSIETLSKKTEYSIRFIEWFSERGEAYEHNISTIERNINHLVQTSDPRIREPYDGRVRFT